MNVSDFKSNPSQKLQQINNLLNQLYGLSIDWTSPQLHLESVLANYEDRKELMLAEGMVGMTSPDYTKTVLIVEAIRMYLREIAPNRKKKPRRPQ